MDLILANLIRFVKFGYSLSISVLQYLSSLRSSCMPYFILKVHQCQISRIFVCRYGSVGRGSWKDLDSVVLSVVERKEASRVCFGFQFFRFYGFRAEIRFRVTADWVGIEVDIISSSGLMWICGLKTGLEIVEQIWFGCLLNWIDPSIECCYTVQQSQVCNFHTDGKILLER